MTKPTGRGARAAGIALGLGLAAAACGAGASAPPTGLPSAVAGPTASAATTAPPVTPEPSATPDPSPANPTPGPLPQAEIVAADATIAGALGTYEVDGRGSDAPWPPYETLPAVGVGAHDTLTIRFVEGLRIGDFQVLIAAAGDTNGSSSQDVSGSTLSADGSSLTIGPLPTGSWILAIRLFRADGRGDGLTFWAVTVN